MNYSKIAYFDNAATTFPKPEEVYVAMDSFYRNCGVNVGRGASSAEKSASYLIKETRELLLNLFHCECANVIFEPSATIALNQVIRGIDWSDGDTVYITPFEHNSVLRPLNYLKEQFHLNIIELAVDRETISYDIEKIKCQFQENPPNVVISTHASNVCGVITPIEEIFPLAKKYKAITIADMSQTAGLVDTDLIKVKADFAVFAGHKTLYGPFGIAGFISTSNYILKPLIYGGTGFDSANPFMPDVSPSRYEAGSQNILAIAGLNSALKWIKQIGVSKLLEAENVNKERLVSIFDKYDFIVRYKSSSVSTGIISINIKSYSSGSFANFFANNGVACRTGLQCSPIAHKFLGTFPSGTIRFSSGFFLSDTDFERLNNILKCLYNEL